MRDLIASLIISHDIPIGSSTSPPAGYFIIATREEAASAYRMLRRYGLSILHRASKIGKIVEAVERAQIQSELPFRREVVLG